MILASSSVRQLAYNAGWRGSHLDAAVEIAYCESKYNTGASCLNCFPGIVEDSRGIWQINVDAHPQYKNVNLYDPAINAQAAYAVYLEAGSSFRPWFNCAKKLGYLNIAPTQPENNYLLFALLGFIFLYSA
jgi:hypothetical protein